MPDVREVTVPDIGDFSDVPIIEVLVSPGDSVAPEDPLITLESDKATMDVPAPYAGVVQDLRVSVGDKVSEGSPILSIAVDGAGGNGAAPAAAAPPPAAQEEDGGRPEAAAPRSVETATVAEESATAEPAAEPQAVEREGGTGGPVYASPSVRRLARERGIDLTKVRGSGRKGRITKADVERGEEAAGPAPA